MSAKIESGFLTIDVAGRTRSLTVVRPSVVSVAAPAVLVFHGSNQTGAKIRRFVGNGFDEYASAGAVVAYLDGYQGHWNDARATAAFAARSEGYDDVAFATAVIDLLIERYRVDAARVFAIGFSNGGQLVIRLAHEVPERLAGIAILSATQPVPANFVPDRRAVAPMPTILFHGTKDPLVPYQGGMSSLWGFRPRGSGLSAPDTAAYYAARNGITAPPSTTRIVEGGRGELAIDRTDYREHGHPPVSLYTVHAGGHTIPGRKSAPRIMGRTAHGIDAARVIGEFLALTKPSERSPAG